MKSIPVLSVKDTPIMPGAALPLRVARAQSMRAVEEARAGDGLILAVAQKTHLDEKTVKPEELYSVGTLSKIENVRGNPKDGYQIFLRGISRFRIDHLDESNGAIHASGSEWPDLGGEDTGTQETMLGVLREMSLQILKLVPADTRQLSELIKGVDDLNFLTYLVISHLDLKAPEKQALLELPRLKDRVLVLLEHMQRYKETLEVQQNLREKLGQKLGKNQRESILREQLRAIQEELGESKDGDLKDNLRKKIDEAGMPENVLKTANDEFKRLETIGPQSPESHVIRNYLDLLVSLPWRDTPAGDLDLDKARSVLDSDHYGLEKIKKRILQHLAVMKLKKNSRGQILLFVGPPGVGKTSLGQSIARALGRKFVRGSLGGVRDDAEIRGHRRTYIGAMPGRIIQGIKRAGENNPVFMLDEIDKLGRGWSGDPAAALLEVLDPEQNASFLDHYLDVPFDLSKVFFIATANSLETIPGPLLDRMEVIDLSGYTTAEKLHIAKNHLVPKQWEEHGIAAGDLELSDEAILKVIQSWTREAGVRSLQRKITTIVQAMAERVLTTSEKPVRVKVNDLEDILGPERFVYEVAPTLNPPGVVTGLAWTPVGGEILFVEANSMPGKGQLIVTGQLGEVMKESTQIALSLVRSRLSHLIPLFEFEKKDIHIHVPAGAIPKDGPSAGITMLTTIASLLLGRSVDSKIAMTGEITLRGAVMPVGGIKEKVIAAHRAGIERIILSKKNERDLREVPQEVRDSLTFSFVENAEEVLKIALGVDPVTPIVGDLGQHSHQAESAI